MTIQSETRRAALFKVRSNLSDRERAVVSAIEQHGPGTCHQIKEWLGLSEVTMVRPRCCELAKPDRRILHVVGERLGPNGLIESVYGIEPQGVLL
jgi:FixJ family two-component response regulator